jgi:two-component system chemotaxis response regulator CheY
VSIARDEVMHSILIVDDSPTIRRMVTASLAGLAGTRFLEAASGLKAIETLAVSNVDAIVLDLNMPDMHGLDVLRFVRSHDRYRHMPVIVLTTRDDHESRAGAMKTGASAYLTKPFTPATLAATVTEQLAVSASGAAVPAPPPEGGP